MNMLKISAGTTMFYGVYLLFFRKDTFYLRNRIYLILTLLLPTIIPVLKIPVVSTIAVASEPVSVFGNTVPSVTSFETAMSVPLNSLDYYNLFAAIYFTITGILLLRVAISLISTYRIIKQGTVNNNQFPKIILSQNHLPPFSFFPFAVIPEEDYKSGKYDDIVDHEFAHIRQGHTFDLLLGELIIAFQWFNPFVWLIKRSIILNHEYLADHVSLRNNKSVLDYQYRLLNFQSGFKNVSLAHNFNSLIKNRIIMINKKPTRKYAMLKNILILPVVAFVVYAFATPEYSYINKAPQPLEIVSKPASIQVKSESPSVQKAVPIVVIDGVITDKSPDAARKELGYNMGIGKNLSVKAATEKYGEKGANGAYEITTRKKALEMGLKPPFPRLSPDDYPTFQGQKTSGFADWVAGHISYPTEAQARQIEGWVTLNFNVELDGTISKIASTTQDDKSLGDRVINAVRSSPKWDRPKNPNVDEPYSTGITIKFRLPNLITADAPFVVVDQMPMFPGGDAEMLKFVGKNIIYPEEAKAKNIQGKVIIRFVVNTEGKAEGVSVLRSVNTLLDAEAVRVCRTLPRFKPGMQNGKAVDVWYAVPITFTLK